MAKFVVVERRLIKSDWVGLHIISIFNNSNKKRSHPPTPSALPARLLCRLMWCLDPATRIFINLGRHAPHTLLQFNTQLAFIHGQGRF